MEVEELLRKVAKVYATCRSYRDRGEVTTVVIHEAPARRFTSVVEFETAWMRPDRFRFEFVQREIDPFSPWRYVVWWNGGEIRSWWTLKDEIQAFDSLSGALAGAVGVSRGTASLVPELLVADGFRRLAWGDHRVVVERTEEGVPLHVLEEDICIPVNPLSRQRTWVDGRTCLIRRVESETGFHCEEMQRAHAERVRLLEEHAPSNDDAAIVLKRLVPPPSSSEEEFRVEQTTRYWPELDQELGPEVFEFEPPASS